MSAFDDEFGLFGDEVEAPSEDERRSTLGARKIATGNETIIDEIEPEDEPRSRRRRPDDGAMRDPSGPRFRRHTAARRDPVPIEIGHPRAVELLTFLAKRLVGNPEAVAVELHPDARGAVLELEVDPEDLGKVIGRGGRVAQALRTLVRAGAEGRVTIDIIDSGEDDEDDEDFPEVVDAAPPETSESGEGDVVDEESAAESEPDNAQ